MALVIVCMSCSSTSSLEADEQLYTGIKKIDYGSHDGGEHFLQTQAEIEAALACAPNGALFGSSFYRTPVPYGLWIWNAFSDRQDAFSKWVTKTFGKAPVLMSDVNPELRVSVAETVLQNYGYFRGQINYHVEEGKAGTTRTDSIPRPLTAKLSYDVNVGPLFTLDSIAYVGFSDDELAIAGREKSLLRKGDPFSISVLDAERKRIYDAFRNNGYYYFRQSYLTFRADTVQVPCKVQLQICKMDSLPEEATRRWAVRNTVIRTRRTVMEEMTDTVRFRRLVVQYAGKKPPLRPRVLLQDMRIRPGDTFSQAALDESLTRLTSQGIFSAVNINMKPENDALSMQIDCTLDKPYDFSMLANYTHKTSGRGGPGVGIGFAKRNAFRGGEVLSFNISGNADFAIGKTAGDAATNYDITADVALEMPRLLLPDFMRPRRRWYNPPSTIFRVSFETINRTGFFRRNIMSAEMLYNLQPTSRIRHTFSPLTLDYSYLASMDSAYAEIISQSAYMTMASRDIFIPKMRYTFNYSTDNKSNPMSLTLIATEGGSLTNLIKTIAGEGWNTKDKTMFKTAYSQFVKLEAEWRKRWMVTPFSSLVAHAFCGYIRPFGNSDCSPFSERYYMGGANDLRGFSTRSVGPGSLHYDDKELMYILSNGDFKMLFNLEYRPRLFGSLYGALFLDAGNVWDLYSGYGDEASLRLGRLADDIAVSAGAGIRYDLDFFVIRLDWGFILHAPYDTGKSGYFNTPSFKNAQCINFAIGYPF